MKLTITVETDKYTDFPWPDGVPLPAPGDEVTLTRSGQTISFVVDRRAFDLGDEHRIHIQGHHAPAGSV